MGIDTGIDSDQRPLQRLGGQDLKKALADWAVDMGFRLAARGEFLAGADVVQEAREATGACDSDSFMFPAVACAVNAACGSRMERRHAPHSREQTAKASDSSNELRVIYWAVTCDTMPATPFGPALTTRRKTDKKVVRAALRKERGLPEPDPTRARVHKNEKGVVSHFTRYTDELLGLRSAPAMLELKLFPNAKELSESFSCFNAVRTQLGDFFKPDDPTVTMIAVGDGITPRTAALFAFRTSWRCISVDPLMTEPDVWSAKVDRLTALRCKIEEVGQFEGERVLLVLPHAHVALATCLRQVRWRKKLGAVVLPCCNWYNAVQGCGTPSHEEEDPAVVSPHRLVRVWHWTPGQCLPSTVPPPEGNLTQADLEKSQMKDKASD